MELKMDSQLEARSQQQAIRRLAFALVDGPTVHVEPVHHFAPGVYVRELTVPAGHVIVGKIHRHPLVNILVKGSALLACDGKVEKVTAPFTFVSGAGRQKAAYVLEDMTWLNIHPTEETDLERIEAEFIEPDPDFEAHKLQAKAFQETIQLEDSQWHG